MPAYPQVLSDAEDRRRYARLLALEAHKAREFGGCISTKHGDGRLRAHCLDVQYGASVAAHMARVKQLFDPQNRFNPGVL